MHVQMQFWQRVRSRQIQFTERRQDFVGFIGEQLRLRGRHWSGAGRSSARRPRAPRRHRRPPAGSRARSSASFHRTEVIGRCADGDAAAGAILVDRRAVVAAVGAALRAPAAAETGLAPTAGAADSWRSSRPTSTIRLTPSNAPRAAAQSGTRRRGGTLPASMSPGTVWRCRSTSDFLSASSMNDIEGPIRRGFLRQRASASPDRRARFAARFASGFPRCRRRSSDVRAENVSTATGQIPVEYIACRGVDRAPGAPPTRCIRRAGGVRGVRRAARSNCAEASVPPRRSCRPRAGACAVSVGFQMTVKSPNHARETSSSASCSFWSPMTSVANRSFKRAHQDPMPNSLCVGQAQDRGPVRASAPRPRSRADRNRRDPPWRPDRRDPCRPSSSLPRAPRACGRLPLPPPARLASSSASSDCVRAPTDPGEAAGRSGGHRSLRGPRRLRRGGRRAGVLDLRCSARRAARRCWSLRDHNCQPPQAVMTSAATAMPPTAHPIQAGAKRRP